MNPPKMAMYKQQLTLDNLKKNLVDFMPEDEQPYCGTVAYDHLVNALFDALKAKAEDRDEKFQRFAHEKDNWKHMIETTDKWFSPNKQLTQTPPETEYENIFDDF